MHGDERDAQPTALAQLRQGGVGMLQYFVFQPLQARPSEGGLASGIRRFGFHRARLAIALQNILHGAFGDAEPLGDLPHGLAVVQACGQNAPAKI